MTRRSRFRRLGLAGAAATLVASLATTAPVHAIRPAYGSASVTVVVAADGTPRLLGRTAHSVSLIGTGRYVVSFDGLGIEGGNAQVIPWASATSTARPPICTVGSWTAVDVDTEVEVVCFDAATGRPAPGTKFTVVFNVQQRGVSLWTPTTYLWADRESSSAAYIPDNRYFFSDSVSADAPQVRRVSRGVYQVVLDESARLTPLVTAYGGVARWCQPVSLRVLAERPSTRAPAAGRQRWTIACFRPGGRPADSKFSFHGSVTGIPSNQQVQLLVSRPAATGVNRPTTWNVGDDGAASNTYRRVAAGRHQVVMPGADTRGTSVQAFSSAPRRCFVTRVTDDAAGVTVRTRCLDGVTGADADTRVWVSLRAV